MLVAQLDLQVSELVKRMNKDHIKGTLTLDILKSPDWY